MQKRTRNRLYAILLTLAFCSLGVYFILSSLNDNIVFFYPPSEIYKIKSNSKKVRVGGLIKEGSIENLTDAKIIFVVTDNISDLKIEFQGVVPALFREKQGIVAEGKLLSTGVFRANRLLAKHDENYTPPELSKIKNYKD